MAKSKNQITIQFSDGDTLKDLEKKLKKAAGGFDALSTSQRSADRAGKGLSRQSSNQTKNFSKIQQGISGGLVPIYATLAAQVFAVTAAFQFLSNSVDYKNLIEGQQSFGAVTGVALATYTKGVQAATEGQLRYAEAAQSVAIGTAAGLSRNQIEEIGKAAKNTSLALGRDLTDSFNRLTRGITKAEPELLDELGIILRLDPALKAYADKIGKSKEQLNQFEKSQAIANEVLEQAESKFGKIAEIMDPSAFALQQFAVAFDDLVNKFKVGIGTVLLPLLKFLSNNVYALTAALGLFALPIVKTILPNFDAMGKAAKENLDIAKGSLKDAQKEFDKVNFTDNKKTRESSLGGFNAMRQSKGQTKVGAMYSQMTKKQIHQHRMMLKAKEGDYKKYTVKERAIMRKHLIDQERALKVSEAKKRGEYAKTTNFFKLQQARMVLLQKKASVMMVTTTRVAAAAMTKLLSFAGIIGILVMIGSIVMGIISSFKKQNEEQDKLNDTMQNQIDLQRTLNTELQRMNEIRGKGLVAAGLDTSIQFGNMIQSADMANSLAKQSKNVETQRRIDPDSALFQSGVDANAGQIKQKQKNLDYNLGQKAHYMKVLATAEGKQAERLRARLSGIESDIAARTKEIAVLKENNYANEQLNEQYKNSITTLKELEKAALGPLKDMYADARKELENNGKVSEDTAKKLREEESAYIGLTERVKRYGEVSKSYQQSLTSMAGKGLPMQAQRRALNDMIKSQESIIKMTQLGMEDAKKFTGPKTEEQLAAEGSTIKKLGYDKEKLAELNKFKTTLEGIVEAEKNMLTTQQTNARIRLDHANARTIEEKKAKLNATAMLAVEEKQARAIQDEANARAAVFALREKGFRTTESFRDKEGKLDQAALDKYIEEGGILEQNVLDAEYAVTLAEDKVTTAKKEVDVQKILTAEQKKQLDIAENNLKLKAAQLNQDSLALQQQIGNVGFNTMFGGTGFGQRAKKQQDVELKAFEIEKQRLAIATQRDNLDKQNYDHKSTEYLAEMASINNNERKLELLEKQTDAAKHASTFLGELQMSFAKGIEDMFVAIATGSKSAKEAFKDLALFMLKKLAEMAAQQLAMKAMLSMGIVPLARGGIIPMAKGGVISKYSNGGIATEPTYLVGEGKHNEAVVPLPDGRSIPVDMKGGSGTNNVSISVNVDGSSTNSFDSEKGKALGKAMEVAVMEVIQREKRPGGVLGR